MIVGIMISKNGLDTVTAAWNGKVFRARDRHGAVFALARQLVAAGIPEMPISAIPPGGGPELFRVPSIHQAATQTIVEGEHGETMVKYRDGPAARRAKKHLAGMAVSFAVVADCVLASDAGGSPSMLARHGVRPNDANVANTAFGRF